MLETYKNSLLVLIKTKMALKESEGFVINHQVVEEILDEIDADIKK